MWSRRRVYANINKYKLERMVRKMRKKKIICISILILMITLFSTCVYATPIDSIMEQVQSPDGDIITRGDSIRGKILFIVQLIGTIVAICTLLVLGIKYMIAAPDRKADIKKQAVIYIIGAFFLFGAVGVVEIIKQFGTEL